ncbi:MAG: hypothetical protein IPI73_12560 [Betaproteobacteria bacterium]|nr:hypothetical protein [Betaproteobacteria bacterium]
MLLAIPNMTPDVVDAYIVQRELARLNSQPAPPLPQAVGYVSIGATGFHVNATVRMPDSEVFVREVVVQPTGNPKRPLQYLAWREGLPLEYPEVAITSQAANPANPGLPAQSKP